MDLSIIIPHYNSAKKLKRLLLSIPQHSDVETIVIDDKSNKLEYSQVKEMLNQKRFSKVTFLENNTSKKGAGVCRNIGLLHAKGKWMLFADSDDFFTTDFLSIINQYFNSKYDIVYFTPTSIIEDTQEISIRHQAYEDLIDAYLKEERDSELFLKFKYYVPWSKLIRSEIIIQNNIKFDEIIASNDVMFSTQIGFHVKEIAVSRAIIYCVTRSSGSLTTTKSKEVFQARYKAFINQYEFLNGKLTVDKIKKFDFELKLFLWIIKSLQYGLSNVRHNLRLSRNRNLTMFSISMFDPIKLIKRYRSRVYKRKKEKGYMEKDI